MRQGASQEVTELTSLPWVFRWRSSLSQLSYRYLVRTNHHIST